METERGLAALIVSARRGKLHYSALAEHLGCEQFRLASRKKLAEAGLKPGAVPLVGHGLPCVFDDALLSNAFVYGGTGDVLHTLQIEPNDMKRLQQVIAVLPPQLI